MIILRAIISKKISWGREDLIMMLCASIPQWYSCKSSDLWSVTYQGFTDWTVRAGCFGRTFYVRKSVLFAFYILVIIWRDNYPVCCIKSAGCQVCYWMLCHFCRTYDIFQSYDIFCNSLPETLSGSIDNESTFGPSLIKIRPKLTGFSSDTAQRLKSGIQNQSARQFSCLIFCSWIPDCNYCQQKQLFLNKLEGLHQWQINFYFHRS